MAITYDLFLESGPRKQKTMVHVPALLGCIANGPTTESALAATPEAIAAFTRFLHRHGEPVDPDEPFTIRVIDHITTGEGLGNGFPYISFAPDLVPITGPEIALYRHRLHALIDELAGWAETRSAAELAAAPPAGGRSGYDILRHVIGAQGAALATALGGAPGFNRLQTAVDRGALSPAAGLQEATDLIDRYLRETTPEHWRQVRELNGNRYTLRKAVRRLLEHTWEHLAELSRRPGGPPL